MSCVCNWLSHFILHYFGRIYLQWLQNLGHIATWYIKVNVKVFLDHWFAPHVKKGQAKHPYPKRDSNPQSSVRAVKVRASDRGTTGSAHPPLMRWICFFFSSSLSTKRTQPGKKMSVWNTNQQSLKAEVLRTVFALNTANSFTCQISYIHSLV
jgi:hypothetical protein